MEKTLHDLGGLMVHAIPTILLLILLYFYFKAMLFGPLEKVLKQRAELTAGARQAADASLAAAERKQQEYERKFAEARAEAYSCRKKRGGNGSPINRPNSTGSTSRHRRPSNLRSSGSPWRPTRRKRALAASSSALAESIADAILSRKTGSLR